MWFCKKINKGKEGGCKTVTGWNPGALRLVANTFRARSLAQCDRNSVFLLHLDGWRKKSVPFVTILESVSLQKYWSTDWNKLFDIHGLQASEGFNSTNSETVKNFPSPSCYWINLKLRCLFVKLLTKYFKMRLFLHLVSLVLKLLLHSFVHSRSKMAGGLQTACSNCDLSEMEGKTCTGKWANETVLGTWGMESCSLFWSCSHLFYRSAKILGIAEGCV